MLEMYMINLHTCLVVSQNLVNVTAAEFWKLTKNSVLTKAEFYFQ